MRIVHQINPLLTDVFGIHLWYYGLAYALGFAGVHLWFRNARRRLAWSLRDVYDFSILFALCVLLFGRVFEIIVYELGYFARHPHEFFCYWRGGMASHGVLLGAAVAAWLYSRKRKISFFQIADELVIPAAFFLGLGRIGNFINGQICGTISTTGWGVQFPGIEGIRHPVTLYESIKNFAIVPILLVVKRRPGCVKGNLTAHFVFWYAFLRIFTDVFRDYGGEWLGIGRGQYFNMSMALSGLVTMVWIGRKQEVFSERVDRGTLPVEDGVAAFLLRRLVFAVLLLFSLTIPSSWSRGALAQLRKEKEVCRGACFCATGVSACGMTERDCCNGKMRFSWRSRRGIKGPCQ